MAIDWQNFFGNMVKQQQGFVQGMAQVPMSSEFGGTLDEMLRTGAPTSTRGTEGAAESEAMRMFERLSGGINERMAAQGKGGSSAQTGMLSRAGTEVSTRMGETIAKLRSASAESAAGRRMGAMGSALSEGQLRLGGKTAQAGAGQDLLSMLKSLQGGGAGGRPEPRGSVPTYQGPRARAQTRGTGRSVPRQTNMMDMIKNLMGGKPSRPTEGISTSGPAFGLGQKRLNVYKGKMDDWQEKVRAFAALMGNTGAMQAQSAREGASTAAWMGAGPAGVAANQPMLQQQGRQDFLQQMLDKYGPGFGS